jgi:hypothetical protein
MPGAPYVIDSRLTNGGEGLSALRVDRALSQKNIPGTHLCNSLITIQAHSGLERVGKLKKR